MEVVALVVIGVLILDPGLIRGILTPRRNVNGAGGTAGPPVAQGGGTNTYNGGPGPTAPGAGVTPSGVQQPTTQGGGQAGGGWLGGITGLLGGLGSAIGGAMGYAGGGNPNGSGAPQGSQPGVFDPYSTGGATPSAGSSPGDPSFTGNNSNSYWGDSQPASGPPTYGAGTDNPATNDSSGAPDFGSGGPSDPNSSFYD